jgi:hypothetical protein
MASVIRSLLVAGVMLHPRAQTTENARWSALNVSEGAPGFTLLDPSATGVRFTNLLDELSSAANRTLENGGGAAIGDYDRDGLPDIFLCRLPGHSALFRNLGEWRFQDVTASAGIPLDFHGRGAVFADINADYWPDLLISTVADGLRCLTNTGTGKFIDVTVAAGTRSSFGCTTLALADVDGNGTIDIYVATYRADDIRDRARIDIRRVGGKVVVAPALRDRVVLTASGLMEFGEPDLLYLNNGQGRFTRAPDRAHFLADDGTGLAAAPRDWGLAASFRDLNNDGAPDLYVCNDYWTPDRAWLNDGRGIFRPLPRLALRHTSENSMGVDFADVNGDGHLDFFVTDMLSRDPARRKRQAAAQTPAGASPGEYTNRPQYMRNMLFVSNGDGTYAEVAEYAGLSASEWSWQPVFIDIDLDGWPDLLIPAGHSRDVQDLDATEKIRSLQHPWPRDMDPRAMQHAFTRELMEHARFYPRYDAPIVTFRNRGDLTFQDMTARWGTGQLAVHQGLALGDLDGDGDLDFVVNNLNSPAALYRNDSSAPRVAVRLQGSPPNTEAIGARVTLRAGDWPPQMQEVVSGGRYLSGFDTLLVFAAPPAPAEMRLQVKWRAGPESILTNLQANRLYRLTEP